MHGLKVFFQTYYKNPMLAQKDDNEFQRFYWLFNIGFLISKNDLATFAFQNALP